MTFNPDDATIALFGGHNVNNHANFMRRFPADDALKLGNTYRSISLMSFNCNSRITKYIGTLCDSNIDGGKTGVLTVLTNGDGFPACKINREDYGRYRICQTFTSLISHKCIHVACALCFIFLVWYGWKHTWRD